MDLSNKKKIPLGMMREDIPEIAHIIEETEDVMMVKNPDKETEVDNEE